MIRHHLLVLACLLAAFLVAATSLADRRSTEALAALISPAWLLPQASDAPVIELWRAVAPLS